MNEFYGKTFRQPIVILLLLLVSRMSSGHGGAHINPEYPLTQEVTDTSSGLKLLLIAQLIYIEYISYLSLLIAP